MDFREWQAKYDDDLAEIEVRTGDDIVRAGELASRLWTAIVSQERIGYGVFKLRSSDQWTLVTAEVNRRLNAGIPADWCICGGVEVHVYEASVCRA